MVATRKKSWRLDGQDADRQRDWLGVSSNGLYRICFEAVEGRAAPVVRQTRKEGYEQIGTTGRGAAEANGRTRSQGLSKLARPSPTSRRRARPRKRDEGAEPKGEGPAPSPSRAAQEGRAEPTWARRLLG